MARQTGQKLKLMYIRDILNEYTDEEHPMSTKDLIAHLEAHGVSAERKSIYDDIAQLIDYGCDIVTVSSRNGGGYYMASREFELPELKLLVDAVQSSRFITTSKSRELIGKLEAKAGKHDAGKLKRQVIVAGRTKTENEKIYYNIDNIHRAIQENHQIAFTYMDWNLKKELKARENGDRRISPWALIWREENYYLLAYDEKDSKMKHYRVDKMGNVEVSDNERLGRGEFEKIDLASYANQTFGMYGGEEEMVSLIFPNHLIGVVMDRFGKNTDIRPLDDNIFRVRTKVVPSGPFYGWIAGLGKGVRIQSPDHIREAYCEWLKSALTENETSI